MRLFSVFSVTFLVVAFSLGCAPSSDSGTTPVPAKTPEETLPTRPAVLTHELDVIVEPSETAIVLLNPKPFGEREYVHGRTVTIDVLPRPGWEVDEWLGPVFEVAGRTAKINMNVSHSVIVSLVQSSAMLPTQAPILGRVVKPLPTAAHLLPTSAARTADAPIPEAPVTSDPAPDLHIPGPAPCLAETRAAFIESKSFDSQGEYEKAIEKLDEVIRVDRQCAAAYSSRGFAALHIGRNHQALQDYNEAIRLAPEAGDVFYSLYNRGLVYSDLGQHRRGIQDFNEAIRLKPGQGWLYDGRATIYDRLGETQKAIADRHQACQLKLDREYCGATERPRATAVSPTTPKPTSTPAPAPTRTPAPTPTMVPTPTAVPTFKVTKTADTYDGTCNDDCSLREAIIAAGQGATIRIPAGTYTLVIQELSIYEDLTLIGAGPQKTIIQAANSAGTATHRVFDVQRNSRAFLSGMTVRYGREEDPSGGYGGGISNDGVLSLTDVELTQNAAIHGGAIYNNGTLTMTDSVADGNQSAVDGGGISNDGRLVLENTTISGNESKSGAGIHNAKQAVITGSRVIGNKASLNGGGILSRDQLTLTNTLVSGNESQNAGGGIKSNGRLVLTDSTIEGNIGGVGGGIHQRLGFTATGSTISGNTAKYGDGGGIYIEYGDVLTFTNVTVSDNTAREKGGGLFLRGEADLTLSNSTITGNRAETDGGGVYNEGKLTFVNSILAGNSVGRKGPDCYGDTISLGHNIIGDRTSCGWIATVGDVVGVVFYPVDPKLGPLLDNGGPAKTHAILSGSPAIDAGDDTNCPASDQRGTSRPQGAACDIGAYEKQV